MASGTPTGASGSTAAGDCNDSGGVLVFNLARSVFDVPAKLPTWMAFPGRIGEEVVSDFRAARRAASAGVATHTSSSSSGAASNALLESEPRRLLQGAIAAAYARLFRGWRKYVRVAATSSSAQESSGSSSQAPRKGSGRDLASRFRLSSRALRRNKPPSVARFLRRFAGTAAYDSIVTHLLAHYAALGGVDCSDPFLEPRASRCLAATGSSSAPSSSTDPYQSDYVAYLPPGDGCSHSASSGETGVGS